MYTPSFMWPPALRFAATLWLALACAAAYAQAQPLAGRDYLVLDPPQPAAPGGTIEVIEFFDYGCPVCYESQPHIARWLASAGADISFTRVPAASGGNAESFALTYYALEASGQLARFHWPIYDNHHFDDRRLHQESDLLDWLGRNGVDAEAVRRLRDSAQNRARVAEGRKLFESYNVRAVPAFVVDGRFLTSARLADGVKEMMDVVAYLVARARQERPVK